MGVQIPVISLLFFSNLLVTTFLQQPFLLQLFFFILAAFLVTGFSHSTVKAVYLGLTKSVLIIKVS